MQHGWLCNGAAAAINSCCQSPAGRDGSGGSAAWSAFALRLAPRPWWQFRETMWQAASGPA